MLGLIHPQIETMRIIFLKIRHKRKIRTHDHKFPFEMFICVLGGYEKLINRFTRRHEK